MKLPQEILHPYHPRHPLRIYEAKEHENLDCDACRSLLTDIFLMPSHAYRCSICGFHLHFLCAKRYLFISPLKHKCHQHILHYMEKKLLVGNPDDFLEEHWTNSDKVVNNDCEADVVTSQISQEYPVLADLDEIQDFSNNHELTLYDDRDGSKSYSTSSVKVCDGCKELIRKESHYSCCFCSSYYHKLCAELPLKIRHPLHSLHPLTLSVQQSRLPALCDGCLHVSQGVSCYKCKECKFMLHIECAHQFQNSQTNKKVITSSIHDHELTHVTCMEDSTIFCGACIAPIIPQPAYGCFSCFIFFHEACVEIPQCREHPYHPQHPLLINQQPDGGSKICSACGSRIFNQVTYACSECKFAIHVSCADYVTSTLKSSCHDHILFSFATEAFLKRFLKEINKTKRRLNCITND
ncbi:hypothetical protein Tsubulata_009405 [Turnera subulata]|uniref:Phorbol-ester/DAG-type domain-containing protein n=1 Tax=Turnera subulata TaxID=218843 RepID=A0A9Q0J0X2_9ROSI|nr:hypothetical protein Tsubulata_009405 [Turnera subulata]